VTNRDSVLVQELAGTIIQFFDISLTISFPTAPAASFEGATPAQHQLGGSGERRSSSAAPDGGALIPQQ
jgi:hypothetical protein